MSKFKTIYCSAPRPGLKGREEAHAVLHIGAGNALIAISITAMAKDKSQVEATIAFANRSDVLDMIDRMSGVAANMLNQSTPDTPEPPPQP